jgi:hypothetical protein
VEGEAGALHITARTPDMGHTVPLMRIRRSRTTEAVLLPMAWVARAGDLVEVFSGDEDVAAVEDVDDGSGRNERSALVDPIARR